MKILYLILLVLFAWVEFRWSYNRTFKKIGAFVYLPADGGKAIQIATLILFLLCEIFGVIAFNWLTLLLPFLIVALNAPRAQKKAIKKLIQANEEAGISPEQTIRLIAPNLKNRFKL